MMQNLHGSCCALISGPVREFTYRDWVKPQETSVRIVRIASYIRTRQLLTTN